MTPTPPLIWQATASESSQFNAIVRLLILSGQRLIEAGNVVELPRHRQPG
ncbi:hypothetical protein ABC977_15575 [Thioalkalicoccus limnaeus]|uniref:Uncharacterized protein n=1 Tax=Thioalkalicoccus limnaeus TaxID=120681 RepID=A0ABV4BJ36_9GAMM